MVKINSFIQEIKIFIEQIIETAMISENRACPISTTTDMEIQFLLKSGAWFPLKQTWNFTFSAMGCAEFPPKLIVKFLFFWNLECPLPIKTDLPIYFCRNPDRPHLHPSQQFWKLCFSGNRWARFPPQQTWKLTFSEMQTCPISIAADFPKHPFLKSCVPHFHSKWFRNCVFPETWIRSQFPCKPIWEFNCSGIRCARFPPNQIWGFNVFQNYRNPARFPPKQTCKLTFSEMREWCINSFQTDVEIDLFSIYLKWFQNYPKLFPTKSGWAGSTRIFQTQRIEFVNVAPKFPQQIS